MTSIHTGCSSAQNQFKWLSPHSENELFAKLVHEKKIYTYKFEANASCYEDVLPDLMLMYKLAYRMKC